MYLYIYIILLHYYIDVTSTSMAGPQSKDHGVSPCESCACPGLTYHKRLRMPDRMPEDMLEMLPKESKRYAGRNARTNAKRYAS